MNVAYIYIYWVIEINQVKYEFYELFPLCRVRCCPLFFCYSISSSFFIHSSTHFFRFGLKRKKLLVVIVFVCIIFLFCLYAFQPHICVRMLWWHYCSLPPRRLSSCFRFCWFNKFCNAQFYRCHRDSQQPFASFTRSLARSLPHFTPSSQKYYVLKVHTHER